MLATTPAPTVRPTLADREAQALIHRDRLDQLDVHRDTLSPGITISVPSGS